MKTSFVFPKTFWAERDGKRRVRMHRQFLFCHTAEDGSETVYMAASPQKTGECHPDARDLEFFVDANCGKPFWIGSPEEAVRGCAAEILKKMGAADVLLDVFEKQFRPSYRDRKRSALVLQEIQLRVFAASDPTAAAKDRIQRFAETHRMLRDLQEKLELARCFAISQMAGEVIARLWIEEDGKEQAEKLLDGFSLRDEMTCLMCELKTDGVEDFTDRMKIRDETAADCMNPDCSVQELSHRLCRALNERF